MSAQKRTMPPESHGSHKSNYRLLIFVFFLLQEQTWKTRNTHFHALAAHYLLDQSNLFRSWFLNLSKLLSESCKFYVKKSIDHLQYLSSRMPRIRDRSLLVTSEKLGYILKPHQKAMWQEGDFFFFFDETGHHTIVICLSVVHCSQYDINSSDREGSNIDSVPYKNNIFNI